MPRPIIGADKVARFLAASLGKFGALMSAEPVLVNGSPALTLRVDGQIEAVVAVRIDHGLVTGLYSVRNPEKLSRMQGVTVVSR